MSYLKSFLITENNYIFNNRFDTFVFRKLLQFLMSFTFY